MFKIGIVEFKFFPYWPASTIEHANKTKKNHQKQTILSHKVETINMFIGNSGLLNLKSVVVDEGASSLDLWNWPLLTVTIF